MKKYFFSIICILTFLGIVNANENENRNKEYFYIIKIANNEIKQIGNCSSEAYWFDITRDTLFDRAGRLKGYDPNNMSNTENACSFSIFNPDLLKDGQTVNAISNGFNKGNATLTCNNGYWSLISGECNLHCNSTISGSTRSVNSRTCQFPTFTPLKSPHGEIVNVNNIDTNNNGAISYICNDGLWDFNGFNCGAKVCTGNVNWSVGSITCESSLTGEEGQILRATDTNFVSTGSGTGSADFRCQGINGSVAAEWVVEGTPTCIRSFNGSCNNNEFDSCEIDRGIPNNLTENATTAFWYCSGGGLGNQSVQCSKLKNPATLNGVCGINSNTCVSGSVSNTVNGSTTLTWNCNGSLSDRYTLAGNNANCSINKPICGSANGTNQTEITNTTNPLTCNVGTISNYQNNTTNWNWNCNSADLNISCSAFKNSSCGSSNNTILAESPSTNLCNIGSASSVNNNPNTYTWTCTNGTSTSNCTATKTAVCNNSEFLGCDVPNSNATSYTSILSSPTATWNCVNGSSTVACSRAKTAAVNGACGTSNGTVTATAPSGAAALCASGTATAVTTGATAYTWSCNGSVASHTQMGGTNASCSATRTASCGPANGTTTGTVPATNLCAMGTASTVATNANTYTWTCTNGASTSNCTANRTAVCNNSVFLGCSIPATPATVYTSTATNTDVNATWNCSNGSSTVACSRAKTAAVNGACGTSNGTVTATAPSGAALCSSGTATAVSTGSTAYTWSCNGSVASHTQMGGTNASCSATRTASCGTANGTVTSTSPTANLCGMGTASAVTNGSTSFTWTCTNGTSTANCSATKTAVCNNGTFQGCSLGTASAYTSTIAATTATWNCVNGASTVGCSRAKTAAVNGACGTANNTTRSSQPSTSAERCSSGTYVALTATTTQWLWRCDGSVASHTQLGGTNASCSANKPPACLHDSNNYIEEYEDDYSGGDYGSGQNAYYYKTETWRYNGVVVYQSQNSWDSNCPSCTVNTSSGSKTGYNKGTEVSSSYNGQLSIFRWQICR